jgi:hypothetical protein
MAGAQVDRVSMATDLDSDGILCDCFRAFSSADVADK